MRNHYTVTVDGRDRTKFRFIGSCFGDFGIVQKGDLNDCEHYVLISKIYRAISK
jgi:hypothetical protein